MKKRFQLTIFLFLMVSLSAAASEPGQLKPDKQEKCPVCGMFVYKYPDWTAQIIFSDQSQFYFDGVKDLFKYRVSSGQIQSGQDPSRYQGHTGHRLLRHDGH